MTAIASRSQKVPILEHVHMGDYATRSRKRDRKSLGPIPATDKVREDHHVLHLTALLQPTTTVVSCKIQS